MVHKEVFDVPGRVDGGVFRFPILYKRLKDNTVSFWRQSVIISPEQYDIKINWAIADYKFTRVTKESYNGGDRPNWYGMVWTEVGRYDPHTDAYELRTRHIPSFHGESPVKLKGTAKERNQFTHALMQARGAYKAKLRAGFTTDKHPVKTEPMLAHPFDAHAAKLVYPAWSQPKLDGVRALAHWDGRAVTLKTRANQVLVGFDTITRCIADAMGGRPPRWFDGELYEHGRPLQSILSEVSDEKRSDKRLVLHLFDSFGDTDELFPQRLQALQALRGCNQVRIVDTDRVLNRKTLDTLFKRYLAAGYEGQMVRMEGPYARGRSYLLMKRKVRQSDEWKVIRVECATRGKHAGAFLAVLKAGEHEFKAQPAGISVADMKAMYEDAKANPSKYVGQMATIEYEVLSSDGVPKQPKFIAIRTDI